MHYILTKFLLLPETKKTIGSPCVNAIIKLQNNLAAKEEKYAGYVRMRIKNCMDAMTTSPCEGQNKVIKHGPNKTNRNFHLDKSLAKIVQATLKRLRRRRRAAKHESV